MGHRADWIPAVFAFPILSLFLGYHTPSSLRPLYLVFYLAFISSVFCIVPVDNPKTDYAFSTTSIVTAHLMLTLFTLSDPYDDHWQTRPTAKRDENGKPSNQGPSTKYRELSVKEKLYWCIENSLITRGIGWNWQIPHLPPSLSLTPSRLRQLRAIGSRCTKLYLAHDLSSFLFAKLTADGSIPVQSLSSWRRIVAILAFSSTSITAIELLYWAICTLGPATGLFWTRADEQRPLMGEWTQCRSVRRFWGRCWHQNLRRILQQSGRLVAFNVLRAPRGSRLSNYAQSYTAFTLSAVYHWLAAKTIIPDSSFNGTLFFLFVQPNAFVLEDVAEAVARRLGVSGRSWFWRVVGVVWTVLWLGVTAGGFVDECVMTGFVDAGNLVGFSVVRGVLEGRWGV